LVNGPFNLSAESSINLCPNDTPGLCQQNICKEFPSFESAHQCVEKFQTSCAIGNSCDEVPPFEGPTYKAKRINSTQRSFLSSSRYVYPDNASAHFSHLSTKLNIDLPVYSFDDHAKHIGRSSHFHSYGFDNVAFTDEDLKCEICFSSYDANNRFCCNCISELNVNQNRTIFKQHPSTNETDSQKQMSKLVIQQLSQKKYIQKGLKSGLSLYTLDC